MTDLRIVRAVSSVTRGTDDDQWMAARGTREGAIFTAPWLVGLALEGRVFIANGGTASTPVTFAGAYDADAPDLFIHVPSGTTIIPVYIGVKYEAIGTESEVEVIALASSTGDSSATVTGGAAITIRNMRVDAPRTSNCTASYGVDAAGITDQNAGNYYEFWRRGHPLKDTSASGENDRHEQVYIWSVGETLVPPVIVGVGSLSVYAAAQASTGFLTAIWAEVPSTSIV